MVDLNPSDKTNMYYFVDDATLTVFYSEEMIDNGGLVYLGTSDNKNPKIAVAAFTQQGKITSGYRIREM